MRTLCIVSLIVTLYLGGCSLVGQNALDPIDWTDKEVERHAASGRGFMAQLRKDPLIVGPYTAAFEARSPWNNLPVQTSTDVQVGLGAEGGRQASAGTTSLRNESEMKIRLYGPVGELASIQCRQVLNVENWEARVTNKRGENDMSVAENIAYDASLNCRSRKLGPAWPQWQLDMHATGKKPLHGILRIDGHDFEVSGSQASTVGVMPDTVSYEVRQNSQVLALIDRSSEGQLSIAVPISENLHTSLFGAAAVLLLAHDPLSPQ
ncbi:hypothetical protein [Litorivivens sp.]|uniref:hypothetical protein n=1 Tax=Litorivivens sp. TaxID=2020868 RepID=UPI00356324A5